jgi:hypothetical protein
LIDRRLEVKANGRDAAVIRFRAKRVGLAIEFLGKKIKTPPDGATSRQEFSRRGNVRIEAIDFFADIGAGCEQHGLLMEAVGIERRRRAEQSFDLLGESGADGIARARRI